VCSAKKRFGPAWSELGTGVGAFVWTGGRRGGGGGVGVLGPLRKKNKTAIPDVRTPCAKGGESSADRARACTRQKRVVTFLERGGGVAVLKVKKVT